jgi:Asp/Glu/hydantoin racemase
MKILIINPNSGSGMTGLDKRLQEQLGIPVLDGVVCALILASGSLSTASLQVRPGLITQNMNEELALT